MQKIHDIDTCYRFLDDKGESCFKIKETWIDKGKIKYSRVSNFNPFNGDFFCVFISLCIATFFSLILGCGIGSVWAGIISFFLFSVIGILLSTLDRENYFQRNIVFTICTLIIFFLLTTFCSYRTQIRCMEKEMERYSIYRDNKEYVEKYNKLKNTLPYYVFYFKKQK